MQIGINLAHHDHDYVEKRGGHVLWSHFRGAPARCSYRRAALQRAFELYERAVSQGAAPDATSGPALLGRLLHSLHGMPSWQKLIAVTLEDLDEVYREVVTSPDAALRTFILPHDSALAAEPRLTEPQRSAIRELRD